MKHLSKILFEAARQAIQSLVAHKLRSFLSLLGIAIGIFCIVGVLSVVDSLEDNISASFDKLGQDVIYVNRFSWTEDPGQNYWKWMKNPQPSYKDFQAIKTKVRAARLVSLYTNIGKKVAKFRSTSVEGGALAGLTADSGELMGFEYEDGRYFSNRELDKGAQKIILGYTIAQELFGTIDPIGRKILIGGKKLEVIGVLQKSGDSLVNFFNWDESMMIPFNLAKRYANLKEGHKHGATITVRAQKGIALSDLKEEMRAIIRARHRLKPKEKDDFALNEVSILKEGLSKVFTALNIAGIVIGGFALLVGMFSVANIMFVSVKERTNIIGIKKALGAKAFIVLLEFLMESIFLCLFGGLLGLGLIALLLWGVSTILNFDLYLDLQNIIIGFLFSFFTGILAGVIPARQAAKLDPVVAIRA